MIKLINDYVVAVDSYNYTLQIDLHKTDKNGNSLYKTIGYYSDLKRAIKACIKDISKTELVSGMHTLIEAVRIIDDSNKRFEAILEKALKESGANE